ncbi:DUF1659 domain-containing protein [Peribacillus tepidiphilus]|jgi:hypothetical protein|uniref:DUF1659 domain-containing protein n=1 Tax=Peribacillus tepidiphilus TaxID=2652445 RepID=UPI0012929825|nr:DUF1659 domain-containing protein [Peribacillus tepidiphilus]
MATETLLSKVLRLTFDAGLDEKGEPILKRKSYSNMNISATSEQLYATAVAIASLQAYPILSVECQEMRKIDEL